MSLVFLFAFHQLVVGSFGTTSLVHEFHITETDRGLEIPYSDPSRIWTLDLRRHESLSVGIGPRFFDNFEFLDSNNETVPVPRDLGFGHEYAIGPSRLSITPFSTFAAHFRTAMLLPPPSVHSNTFILKTGLTDPETYCREGTMTYAEMARQTIGFSARVSLIAAPGRTNITHTSSAEIFRTQRTTQVGFKTSRPTVLPPDVYAAWVTELFAIAGVPNPGRPSCMHGLLHDIDWSPFVHLLPSIQYTIYRSLETEEEAVRIVIEPSEYIEVRPLGAYIKIKPAVTIIRPPEQPAIGIDTLRHIGVFLDYENSQIGFCDPIL